MENSNKKPRPIKEVMAEATELLKQYQVATLDPPNPVDCIALLDLIQAAQQVYAEHCPIA